MDILLTYFKNTFYPPQGKVFLITGASRGIGKAIALKLASQGKIVILVARNESKLIELRDEIKHKYNMKSYTISFDVTRFDSYDTLLEKANSFVPVDTIILNAGILSSHPVGKHGFDKDLPVLETNLIGPVSCINSFVSYAKEKNIENPHIVIITSVAAYIPAARIGAYNASKAGLTTYLNCCALELQQQGFYFTNILPGFITTDMTENLKPPMSWFSISVDWCANETVSAINNKYSFRFIPHYMYYPLSSYYSYSIDIRVFTI